MTVFVVAAVVASRPAADGSMARVRRELAGAALLLRFVLELGLFASFAWWGWQAAGWWLATVALAAGVGVWGVFLSPRAVVLLPWPVRAVLEIVTWALGLVALSASGLPGLALIAAGVLVVDLAVLVAVGEWRRPGSALVLG